VPRSRVAATPDDTIVADLMTEVMPRLVSLYGAAGVATVLEQLANEIVASGKSSSSPLTAGAR
jgi:hypothetical protein